MAEAGRRIVREPRWLLIAAGAALGIIVAGLYSVAIPHQYESTAKVFVAGTDASLESSALANGQTFASERIKSYVEVAESPLVLDPVIKKLKLALSAEDLVKKLTIDQQLNSVVIGVTAEDTDPQAASDIANAIVAQLPTAVAAVENPDGLRAVPVSFTVFEPATPARSASSPNTKLNLAAGLVLGAVIGFGAYYVAQRRHQAALRRGRGVSARALRQR